MPPKKSLSVVGSPTRSPSVLRREAIIASHIRGCKGAAKAASAPPIAIPKRFISKPNLKKDTEQFSSDSLLVAVTSMQGWRDTMEDGYCVLLPVASKENLNGMRSPAMKADESNSNKRGTTLDDDAMRVRRARDSNFAEVNAAVRQRQQQQNITVAPATADTVQPKTAAVNQSTAATVPPKSSSTLHPARTVATVPGSSGGGAGSTTRPASPNVGISSPTTTATVPAFNFLSVSPQVSASSAFSEIPPRRMRSSVIASKANSDLTTAGRGKNSANASTVAPSGNGSSICESEQGGSSSSTASCSVAGKNSSASCSTKIVNLPPTSTTTATSAAGASLKLTNVLSSQTAKQLKSAPTTKTPTTSALLKSRPLTFSSSGKGSVKQSVASSGFPSPDQKKPGIFEVNDKSTTSRSAKRIAIHSALELTPNTIEAEKNQHAAAAKPPQYDTTVSPTSTLVGRGAQFLPNASPSSSAAKKIAAPLSPSSLPSHDNVTVSLFGVFDGHGGAKVSTVVSRQMVEWVTNTEDFKRGRYEKALMEAFVGNDVTVLQEVLALNNGNTSAAASPTKNNNMTASPNSSRGKSACVATSASPANKNFKKGATLNDFQPLLDFWDQGGCTANVVMIVESRNSIVGRQFVNAFAPASTATNETTSAHDEVRILCANAGDSRSMLVRASGLVVPLSNDHTPEVEEEVRRIERADGFVEISRVTGKGRVEGILAVSRAFGDFDFKANRYLSPADQQVIVTPEIRSTFVHIDPYGHYSFPFVPSEVFCSLSQSDDAALHHPTDADAPRLTTESSGCGHVFGSTPPTAVCEGGGCFAFVDPATVDFVNEQCTQRATGTSNVHRCLQGFAGRSPPTQSRRVSVHGEGSSAEVGNGDDKSHASSASTSHPSTPSHATLHKRHHHHHSPAGELVRLRRTLEWCDAGRRSPPPATPPSSDMTPTTLTLDSAVMIPSPIVSLCASAPFHPSRLQEPLFIVLACDGIWDCLSNAEASRVVTEALDAQLDAIIADLQNRRLLPSFARHCHDYEAGGDAFGAPNFNAQRFDVAGTRALITLAKSHVVPSVCVSCLSEALVDTCFAISIDDERHVREHEESLRAAGVTSAPPIAPLTLGVAQKPPWVGTDNMSCMVVVFKEGLLGRCLARFGVMTE